MSEVATPCLLFNMFDALYIFLTSLCKGTTLQRKKIKALSKKTFVYVTAILTSFTVSSCTLQRNPFLHVGPNLEVSHTLFKAQRVAVRMSLNMVYRPASLKPWSRKMTNS